MNILTIGDIVGESGLKKLKIEINFIKEKYKIDFTIANGENAAGGMGITQKHFNQIIDAGVNVVTLGNHTWSKKDIFNFINNEKILRPANLPEGLPGNGFNIFNIKGKKICVINLIGRTNMGVLSENPFIKLDRIISEVNDKADIIIVDFHAEATAEKIALSNYVDGRVNIVFGTHTHVQTADEIILPKGTAYITDIGMTGPINSVIGMNKEASIKRFLTTLPEKYKLADGECKLNGCIFKLNDENCRIESIKRINI